MHILLANPRGFCAGVDRAISIVENALEKFGRPIYVRHEVVHNRHVVETLRAKGAVFVDELINVPDGNIVIFSAHGVAKSVHQDAKKRGLKVFDATCPLVSKVHMEVHRASLKGHEVVMIGHQGHPEVEGTLGQYENKNGAMYLVESLDDVAQLAVQDPDNLWFVTQTTLSVDDTESIIKALQARFPAIRGPRKDDICYATQNRQDAVRALAQDSDVVLVVGSRSSSNSTRLKELAEQCGVRAYLIDDAREIDTAWLNDVQCIGLTAGASAPEILVQDVISTLKKYGADSVQHLNGIREAVRFELPPELRIIEVQ